MSNFFFYIRTIQIIQKNVAYNHEPRKEKSDFELAGSWWGSGVKRFHQGKITLGFDDYQSNFPEMK